MNEKNPDVKIIRLITGEDIVGNCLFDDEGETLVVDSPMKVMVQRSVDYGKAVLVMMPWLPLEIIEENIVTINYDDIITTIIPKESFIEFYANTLEKYERLVREGETENYLFEDDFDEEDADEESLNEILDELQGSRNKLIH
jgi:hypothetical protein